MHKKFEINQTKIKGSCQSRRKVVTHNSKSDLPLKEAIPFVPSKVLFRTGPGESQIISFIFLLRTSMVLILKSVSIGESSFASQSNESSLNLRNKKKSLKNKLG